MRVDNIKTDIVFYPWFVDKLEQLEKLSVRRTTHSQLNSFNSSKSKEIEKKGKEKVGSQRYRGGGSKILIHG